MEDPVFCTNCGKPVSDEDIYCPNCGSAVKGGPADEAMKIIYKRVTERTIMWAGVFLLIASIPSIIIGIDVILNSASIAEYLWGDVSDDALRYVKDFGFIELAIGLIGILGAVLCFMRRYWFIVMIITIFVLFFGISSFLGLFLGLLAMWYVLSARGGFKEYQKEE